MNGNATPAEDLLARIRVVLVQTSHPGNIGAAARALKTMGLTRLVLVRPRYFPDPDANALAANALDVLESAQVCGSLDAALHGTVLSVAMSARDRDLTHETLEVRAAAGEAIGSANRGEVAFVFGNETAGLTNEDILKCTHLACIPADERYRSLNVAHAVQVAAYELRLAALASAPAPGAPAQREYARHEDLQHFYEHLERNLTDAGFLDPANPRRLMTRLRRLFSRARLEAEEVNILRGILTAWDGRAQSGK